MPVLCIMCACIVVFFEERRLISEVVTELWKICVPVLMPL
jgi:hypothetical protein